MNLFGWVGVLHVFQARSTLLGFLFLIPLVVVLVQHVGADIHTVPDNLLRHVFGQEVGNRPTPDRVGACFDGAFGVVGVVSRLTSLWVLTLWTLCSVVARAGDFVDSVTDTEPRWPPSSARE